MSDIPVKIKKGLKATMPSQIEEGTIYVTTDTGVMYADVSSNERIRICDETAVSYMSQSLSEAQKSQARTNIGAGTPDSIKIIEATYYANGESTISSTEEEINTLIAEGKNVCIDCFIEPEDKTFRFYFSTKTSSGTTLFVNTEISDGAPELKLLTLIGSTFMIITMPVPLRSLATESKDGLMSTEDKVKLDSIEEGAQVNVQSDLSQTDETASDYVKGVIRQESLPEGYPYEEVTATDISGTKFDLDGFGYSNALITHNQNIPFELGQIWKVSCGNYSSDDCEVKQADDGTLYIGDTAINSIPFYITSNEGKFNATFQNTFRTDCFDITCISGTVSETTIHPMDEKFLPSSATAQSDWSISDENDPAYVKNRTHYDSREIVSTILEGAGAYLPEVSYELNKEYKIQFGDTEYTCTIQSYYLSPMGCDMYYLGGNFWTNDYSEYPFSIVIGKSTESIENTVAVVHVSEAPASPITVSILFGGELKQLEQKFVPNADWSQGYKDKAGYIENRTHYDDTINVVKHQEELNKLIKSVEKITSDSHVIEGITFRVIVDDVVYDNVPVYNGCNVAGGTTWGIGDLYVAGNWHTTDYGFCYSYNGLASNKDIFPNYIKSIEVCTVEHNFKYLDHKYIKDMYYDNGSTTTLLVDNQTVTGFEVIEDPIYAVQNPFSFSPVVGATYTVTWDGTDYECTASVVDVFTYIGNINYLFMQSGGDIPFAIVFNEDIFLVTESTEESHTISITEVVHDMKQLDEKYLPILEEKNKEIFSIHNISTGEYETDIVLSEGTYNVIVDDTVMKADFINNGGGIVNQNDLCFIASFDGGIFFGFQDDEPHSVKIEIPQNVIKEEYLPESVTATPNWNAAEGEDGYIENRTHYEDGDCVLRFTAVNNGSSYSYVSDYETLQPYIDLVNSGATTVYVKMNDVIVETTPGYYDIAFSLYYGEGFTTGNRLVVNYQGGTHGTTLRVYPKLVDPEYSADTVDICILTTNYYELKQIDEKFLPDSAKDTVRYVKQTLTDEQKARARTNIGAMSLPAPAEVGQLIRVAAIDENGNPTDWKPFDFFLSLVSPDGSEWNLDVTNNGELKLARDTVFKEIVERTITEINSDVTSIGDYIFYGCTSLTTANFPIATRIGDNAFTDCTALTTVNSPNVTSIGNEAFMNCTALTTADFPSVTSISGGYIFQNCISLTTVNFPTATSIDGNAFQGCTALTAVVFPSVTSTGNSSFSGCIALTTVDLPSATNIGGSNGFRDCNSLSTLILRNTDTVCRITGSNTFTNTPIANGTGYIYVPAALIEDYKTSSSWSTYSAQIRAIEDYPNIYGGEI